VFACSSSRATGRTSRSTNARIVSTTSLSSGVRSNMDTSFCRPGVVTVYGSRYDIRNQPDALLPGLCDHLQVLGVTMTIEQELASDATTRSTSVPADAGPERAGNGRGHSLGLRDQIPKVGLTEYWYPVIADKDVPGRRAVRRKALGQDIAFFRGKHGQ